MKNIIKLSFSAIVVLLNILCYSNATDNKSDNIISEDLAKFTGNLTHKDLIEINVLEITIPMHQRGKHLVEVFGDFKESMGVEVHTHNPYNRPISRIKELTLSNKKFRFYDLNLNDTGYTFYIWMNSTHFDVASATPVADFRVTQRLSAIKDGSLEPNFPF